MTANRLSDILSAIMLLTGTHITFDANANRPMYGCGLSRVIDPLPAGFVT
ncbi:MAG: hypothetical protein IMF16_02665 [Proteobacteria bacterium]|nr:hypothetical protein [Pseudomonadota bacterium]